MSTVKLEKLVLLLENGKKIYIFTTDFSAIFNGYLKIQKQPSKGVLKKSCSENMQQI